MKKTNIGYLAASLLLIGALLAGCAGEGGGESTTPSAQAQTTENITTPDTTTPDTTTPDTTTPDTTTPPTTTQPTEEPTEPATPPTTTESDGNDDPPADASGAAVAALAKQQLGKPYRYGSAGPDDFDNSGFLYYCYGQQGITVPRRTGDLYRQGTAVEKTDLQPGDAVFFWNESEGNPEFAAIYVGDGLCIAARQENVPVSELNMTYAYFEQHYVGARRYTAG